MTDTTPFDRGDDWASILAVLADCVRKPDEDFVEDVDDGIVHATLDDLANALDLRPAPGTRPPELSSVGQATEAYLSLFDAMRTPYAPLAESPYKPWYGDRSGLMGGPPATDMARRFDAIDASFPPGYPPDHLALELEYASFLFESGAEAELTAFVDEHLDWIPALVMLTEDAVADAPFYRWTVKLVDDVTVTLRTRLDIGTIDDTDIETMVDRVDAGRSNKQSP